MGKTLVSGCAAHISPSPPGLHVHLVFFLLHNKAAFTVEDDLADPSVSQNKNVGERGISISAHLQRQDVS